MQKRFAVLLAILAISGGLLACSNQNVNGQSTDEVKVGEASPTPGEVEMQEVKVEKFTETDKVAEVEPTEEAQKKITPIWYMDEEGIKSDKLGVMIKRDSAEWNQFGFSGTVEDDWLTDVGIYCSDFGYNADHTAYVGGNISIKSINSKLNPNSSADERIAEYINNRVNYGSSAIEDPVEKTLGNYKYIGKGCLDEYGSEDWLLASDETNYDITISFSDEFELENYLCMIEELK